MKKTASFLLIITLITSLFYNAVDYCLMISYEKEQTWIQSMQNLPESEFKVIKLNATLYTFIEDSEIEQVNENIVINNKVYHIFKKSIRDNVLNLYYLGQENQNAIDINLKKYADSQSDSSQSPIHKLIKDFSKDYVVSDYKLVVLNCSISSKVTSIIENKNSKILKGFFKVPFSPPILS